MLTCELYDCQQMQNRTAKKVRSYAGKMKTINIGDTLQIEQNQIQFRKPKKVIKLLHLKADAYLQNKSVIDEMNNWALEQANSRELKSRSQSKGNSRVKGKGYTERVFGTISQMKEEEHLARQLPLTWRKQRQKDDFRGLLVDLEEVQRIRFKSDVKKLTVQPVQFPTPSKQANQGPLSFRPFVNRFPQKISSKMKDLTFNCLQKQQQPHQNQLMFHFKKEPTSNRTYQRLTQGGRLHKSAKNILRSQLSRTCYRSKSRVKRMWQTVGLHQWTNSSLNN